MSSPDWSPPDGPASAIRGAGTAYPGQRHPDRVSLPTLFLLLLAFFVLLGTFVSFETARVRTVIGSVNVAFASADPFAVANRRGGPNGAILAIRDHAENPDLTLAAALAGLPAPPERVGNRLVLRLATAPLFDPGSGAAARQKLAAAVSRIPDKPPPGGHVAIRLGMGGDVEQAAALGATLAAAGLADLTVIAGGAPPDTLELAFMVIPTGPDRP